MDNRLPAFSYTEIAQTLNAACAAAPASCIHFAAAEAVCEEASRSVITRNNDRFPINEPAIAIPALVSAVMALPVGHPRHDETVAALSAHFETLRAQDTSSLNSLRSTFTLACLSPDTMGLGL